MHCLILLGVHVIWFFLSLHHRHLDIMSQKVLDTSLAFFSADQSFFESFPMDQVMAIDDFSIPIFKMFFEYLKFFSKLFEVCIVNFVWVGGNA